MDYTDAATVGGWLEELYDEAFQAVPGEQKKVRCEALVTFLDSTLHGGREDAGEWWHVDLVQEWTRRALLGHDGVMRSSVWDWVEETIDQIEGDRTKQTLFGSGLFDYLIGPATRWGATPEIDWGDQGWSFVVDKILRTLADDQRQWVAYLAVEGNVERLHAILQEYLTRDISIGYRGPRTQEELARWFAQWQIGEPQA